jgi:hypothetical protein
MNMATEHRMEEQKRRLRLQNAFEMATSIVDLEALPFTDAYNAIQARVIGGEISFDDAV